MIEESDRLASLLKEHPELEEEEYVPSEEFLKQIKGEMKSSDPLLDARYGLLKNSEQTNMPGASAPTLSQVKIDTFLGAEDVYKRQGFYTSSIHACGPQGKRISCAVEIAKRGVCAHRQKLCVFLAQRLDKGACFLYYI